MDERRVRGILTQGVFAPAVTISVVVGGASLLGTSVGLVVLGLSMVGAAGLTAILLADTRGMQPDEETVEGDGFDARSPVGVRNELTDTPRVPAGNKRVATRFAGGLFVMAALLVLYLGGLFS